MYVGLQQGINMLLTSIVMYSTNKLWLQQLLNMIASSDHQNKEYKNCHKFKIQT